MALSILTTPAVLVNNKSIGAPGRVTFEVDSTTSLTGNDIYIRPGLWLQLNEPPSIATTASTQAYRFSYPVALGTITISPLPTLHPTLHVYSIEVTITSDTRFTVDIRYLYKADRLDYDQYNPTLIDNLFHIEKATIRTSGIYNNGRASVYNENRLFRVEVTEIDPTTKGISSRVNFDTPTTARFWCSDLYDNCDECIPSECVSTIVSGYTFALFRDGLQVPSISAFEDTTLRVVVELDSGSIDDFYIAVYRRDNVRNDRVYWQDLDLAYALFDPGLNALTPSPIPLGPFQTGPVTFINNAANIYTAGIILDSSYFEVGAEYRFFVVINHSSGSSFSCYSDPFFADAPAPPTYGDLSCDIYDYSSASNAYNTCCITSVACGERLKICVDMDETTYNDAVYTNNTSGSFATNFEAIGNIVMENLPTPADILTATQEYQFTTNATGTGGCVTLRVPSAWAGETRYLVFVYVFKLTVDGYTYRDYIYHPVKIVVSALSADLTLSSIVDEDATDIVAQGRICADYSGLLTLTIANAAGATYDFIPMIRQGTSGDDWMEEDGYTNDNLDQLGNNIITATDDDFTGSDATFTIDPRKMALGQTYCVKAIAKSTAAATNPVCSAYDIDVTLTCDRVTSQGMGNVQADFTFTYDILAFAETIDNMRAVFSYNGSQITGIPFYAEPGSATFSFVFVYEPLITFDIRLSLGLDTGCEYLETFPLSVQVIAAGTTSDTITFDPL